jgi:hypothetical protein
LPFFASLILRHVSSLSLQPFLVAKGIAASLRWRCFSLMVAAIFSRRSRRHRDQEDQALFAKRKKELEAALKKLTQVDDRARRVSFFGLPRPPRNCLEKSVTLLRQNTAKDGSAAERRPLCHFVGPDVDLPPTQALQEGNGRSVDDPGNASPFDG